ncbi:hypothetical protein H4R18_000920 [Coemansia javaensis]|uniref:SNARE-complex protein Syntaxin-18 N-terminal domain-containing protein n=1 Tax=Coemansia javaensis TaxID=2761396 RepID=A0A9W8LMC5_9FUNG|nr:hypothetical protein H4R18_000920 [Coemansia javaensis]
MDITSSFRRLVQQQYQEKKQNKSRAALPPARPDILPPRRIDFARPADNAFLGEAYIIARHLRALRQRIVDVRPAYLALPKGARGAEVAAAGVVRVRLSDPERDEIDRGIKTAVREVMAKIQSLGELGEALLDAVPDDDSARDLLRRLVGALDPRRAGANGERTAAAAAGGLHEPASRLSKRDAAAALQGSVLWWLNSRLRTTNQIHAEMQEERLRQRLERQRGLLKHQQSSSSSPPPLDSSSNNNNKVTSVRDEVLQSLSEQQLQQLRVENDEMVGEFENALDQIRDTQRSIAEISALQTQLATELHAQMQKTEQIYNEAVGAVDAVGQGNEHLVEARRNKASARKWVMFVFIALSVVLFFLDWFD